MERTTNKLFGTELFDKFSWQTIFCYEQLTTYITPLEKPLVVLQRQGRL